MTVQTLIRNLNDRGVKLIREEGRLKVLGEISDEDRANIRTYKDKILTQLERKVEVDYARLRAMARYLGKEVVVDGRSVLLWGVTPRGPIIHTGTVLLGVDFEDVKTRQ